MKKELLAILLSFLVVLTTASLVSYSPHDPSLNHQSFSSIQIENLFGLVGAHLSGMLVGLFGVGAFWVPLFLSICSFLFFKGRKIETVAMALLGGMILMLSTATLLSIMRNYFVLWGSQFSSGGLIGAAIASFLLKYTNTPGSVIILLFFLFVGFIIATGVSSVTFFIVLKEFFFTFLSFITANMVQLKNGVIGMSGRIRERGIIRLPELYPKALTWKKNSDISMESPSFEDNYPGLERGGAERFSSEMDDPDYLRDVSSASVKDVSSGSRKGFSSDSVKDVSSGSVKDVSSGSREGFSSGSLKGSSSDSLKDVSSDSLKDCASDTASKPTFLERAVKKVSRRKETKSDKKILRKKSSPRDGSFEIIGNIGEEQMFVLPPLSLLENKKQRSEGPDMVSLKLKAEILENKLRDFGVKGEIVDILPGPVITTFEYRPAPGIKISKIVNLNDDIALALSALSIRINAPIPGKDVVGVEIPNDKREIVLLRETLASREFVESASRLTVALGKDILGNPVSTKMDTMPHLLIAGATGTGKSVGLNAMIISLLYKARPDEVKFIMVDPKRIELSVYDGIPHLISPVVTDMKKAANALFWAVREMERRYELLADNGVRNLIQYNALVEQKIQEQEAQEARSSSPSLENGRTPTLHARNPDEKKFSFYEQFHTEETFAEGTLAVGTLAEGAPTEDALSEKLLSEETRSEKPFSENHISSNADAASDNCG